MPIQIQQTIPILRIFDVAKAREFYLDFLGFNIDWEHRFEDGFPLYMQVSRAGMTLHLSEHHGDACPGSTVFAWMHGLDEFHGKGVTSGSVRVASSAEVQDLVTVLELARTSKLRALSIRR